MKEGIPHDLRRQKKLDFLLQNEKNNESFAEITITNFTKNNDVIPDNIKQILKLGIKNPMGGIANKMQILHKSESLFSHWLDYAQKSDLNSFRIAEVRSLLTLEMQKLHKCNTPNSDCKDLKQFLDQNKHILFVEIDKSKNLALLNLDDYVHKLIRVFSPDKFVKLSNNPLQVDIKNFQKLISKLKPYISLANFRLITPYHLI